ncbi:insulin-like growth factor-binding protein 2-B isoform X2 [Eleginops maclovinus]|uniref:insulin-like growth factor-binding protein 2-B isoform X2 n=1 Tax=Eleginops maclovinus TaxID=56733 RepID=UPI00307FDFF9
MVIYFTYGLLFGYFLLPGILLGDLAFRCPSCTAEQLASCPEVTAACTEIVREPGCGCCPVCAKLEGELCGVYTTRCSSGLRCYPSADSEIPLQQLIHGLGRCGRKVDMDDTSLYHQARNEAHGTENPLGKRPSLDLWIWQESAKRQHVNDLKTRMRINQLEYPQTQKELKSACEQELERVLEEISKMTSEDNRGPLENLYGLKFPNCDRQGLYNLKQVGTIPAIRGLYAIHCYCP